MSRLTFLDWHSCLLLVLPLVSLGTTGNTDILWWLLAFWRSEDSFPHLQVRC